MRYLAFGYVAAVGGMALAAIGYPTWLMLLVAAWIGFGAELLEWRDERQARK